MTLRSIRPGTLLALAALSLAACGGSSAPTPPSVALQPSDGYLVNFDRGASVVAEPLVVKFGGGMNRASVVLSGTLTADAHAAAWSTRVAVDDTLTLTATSLWSTGSGRTLHVAGTAANGTAVAADFTLTTGTTQLTVAFQPQAPALTTDQPIVIAFDFAADPASLVLGGALAGTPHALAWSADHGSVTLTPTSVWATGAAQDLTVQVVGTHSAAAVAQGVVSYDVAGTSPTGLLTPASGALQPTQAITAVFSTTMDQASLSLGGTLSSGGFVPTFASTSVTDDTVIITPLTSWPGGARTLTVTAADLAGHALLTPLAGSYQVAVDAACGTAGGACVNATDCANPMGQLGAWTQTCFATYTGAAATTKACIQGGGASPGTPGTVTASCSACAYDLASCAATHCFAACASDINSAGCHTCVDGAGCSATFATCAGRSF